VRVRASVLKAAWSVSTASSSEAINPNETGMAPQDASSRRKRGLSSSSSGRGSRGISSAWVVIKTRWIRMSSATIWLRREYHPGVRHFSAAGGELSRVGSVYGDGVLHLR